MSLAYVCAMEAKTMLRIIELEAGKIAAGSRYWDRTFSKKLSMFKYLELSKYRNSNYCIITLMAL